MLHNTVVPLAKIYVARCKAGPPLLGKTDAEQPDGTWPRPRPRIQAPPSSAALCWINSCTFSPLGRSFNDVPQLESTHIQLLLSSCCHIHTSTAIALPLPLPLTPRHPRITVSIAARAPRFLGKLPSESGQTCLIAAQLVNPNLNTARLNSERPSSSSLDRGYGSTS